MKEVLLITGNPDISDLIKKGLEENDCAVAVAYDNLFGEKILDEKNYDILILDNDHDKLNCREICHKLRNHNSKTPVLMLTAIDPVENKINCADCIADDYILKPFSLPELNFRVNALNMRSKDIANSSSIKFSDLEVDPVSKTVKRNNKEIKLTAREYKILELMLLNKGRVIDRTEIAEKIWGFNLNAGANVINVHINTLRNKIDKGHAHKLIHTLVGLGYIMKIEE